MAVAVFQARHALSIVSRIADVQGLALVALRSHRVVVALRALVELVRPLAVAVAVALALDRAVSPDVAEVAVAHVRLDAGPSHAALRAHGYTRFSKQKLSISLQRLGF